jgi:hypothetical protein
MLIFGSRQLEEIAIELQAVRRTIAELVDAYQRLADEVAALKRERQE